MKKALNFIGVLFLSAILFSCQKDEDNKPKTDQPKTYIYKMVNFIFTPPSGYRTGGTGSVYYIIDNKTTNLMLNDVWNNGNTYNQSYQSFTCPVGSTVYYNFGYSSLYGYRAPLLSISIDNNILFINSSTLSGNFSVQ